MLKAFHFLDEDGFGKVHQEGGPEVHVIDVRRDGMALDPAFSLDFDTAFPTGPARPHGLALE